MDVYEIEENAAITGLFYGHIRGNVITEEIEDPQHIFSYSHCTFPQYTILLNRRIVLKLHFLINCPNGISQGCVSHSKKAF